MNLIYECPDAPPGRRFLAQNERIADRLYVTCHGATAAEAGGKLELMNEYARTDVKDRTGFNLKARLQAIGGQPEQPVKRTARASEDDLI